MRAEQDVREAIAEETEASHSLYLKVGELLGLKSSIASEVDLVGRLEKGLPAGVVQALRARVGLSDEEIYQLIAPRRTLNRREAEHQALSRDEADRVGRVARIAARAQGVFSAKPVYDLWGLPQPPAPHGRGGFFASARWPTRGPEILYCAPNPATALLEVLVNSGV